MKIIGNLYENIFENVLLPLYPKNLNLRNIFWCSFLTIKLFIAMCFLPLIYDLNKGRP